MTKHFWPGVWGNSSRFFIAFLFLGVATIFVQQWYTIAATAENSTQGLPPVVEGRQFVALDSRGKPRVLIGVDDHDVPRMDFLDDRGTTRIMFAVIDKGPGVFLYDAKAKVRIAVGIKEETGASVELFDETGSSAARFMVSPDYILLSSMRDGNNPQTLLTMGRKKTEVSVFGEKGSGSASISLAKDFRGILFKDPNDVLRTTLGSSQESGSLLGIGDQTGILRAQIYVDTNSQPALLFYDKDGKPAKAFK